ncbi:Chromosomal replication initiator protein DnaA [Sphingobium herbicidovorans NBRC 16415]|uniref:Chromosomal replication initiator protein DnaA n=1 Tax=Sphingobium herbicidovorans (strain ATCC 700291 / DSM 11019 / CCUG 56400 / KCTC 2939 / LMG 18315 / NBRC 16415 / MH) TaxID=1219045 RepID=A0A086PB35_SPHHM|nr:chromosomal replication initiator protein DnaA [Sphingobium herbicidovorans]KFG90603.1 Chromosomal replication initiator protein DnaA [Sphingobium herbicidovorans NBRC 16415]
MSQISLPFEWPGQGAEGDFLVSDANSIAVRHLEGWRDWPLATSVLSGPALSGRSMLGRRFAAMSGGRVIDDAEGQDDRLLFNAWNDAQTSRRPLLLIGRNAPTRWDVALPDLRSRLAAAPHVVIAEPDEPLARALIERSLGAMGAHYAADLPDWLLRRIERSYGVIAQVTRLLNEAALSSARKISVAMAKETLQDAGYLPIVPDDPQP